MGVKKCEELLQKTAIRYVYSTSFAKDQNFNLLKKAAMLYAASKARACESRDKWKLRKRLGRGIIKNEQ